MKKLTAVVLSFVMMFSTIYTVSAKKKSEPITFYYEGGGRFIYENNIESLRREDLSDTSNPNPKYIMKNTSLKPGKYSAFITNLNATGIKDESGNVTEPGFDIEIDALFESEVLSKVKVTALGFEVPEINTIYQRGQKEEYEETWSCMNAWADYLDMPIYQKDNFRKYINIGFEEKEFIVNENNKVWISQYIENYRTVPYLKPVNILVDFEVVEGCVDFNICALKSTGVLKDRSNHVYDAPEAPFSRDRQYKGIAETLPKVNTTLDFMVDYSMKVGDFFPVMIYNQYNTAGRRTDRWVTNLNPQNAPWAKDLCTESDMIVLKYKDETKLDMYGSGVGDLAKDKTWYFDVYHADNTEKSEDITGKQAKKYTPNSELDRYTDNYLNACNLGNYGVRVHYDLTVSNGTRDVKYFNYLQETSANNIVIVYDKDGNVINGSAICKGNKASGAQDVMASVELPAGKKTKFSIEVILPANNNGGTINSFYLSDTKAYIGGEQEVSYEVAKGKYKHNGKEFYKFEADKLYISEDAENWEEKNLPDSAKKVFSTMGNNYKIVATDNGYMAKWGEYDGAPAYFAAALDHYAPVYIFDKDFNLKTTATFPKYPTAISYSDSKYYVTAGDEYYSEDGEKWHKLYTLNHPSKANGLSLTSTKYGYFFLKSEEMEFCKLDFQGEMPKYVKSADDIFYYTDVNKIYVSKTGLYWDEIEAKEDIMTIDKMGDTFLVNGKEEIKIPQIKEDIIIKLNHEIPVSKSRPYEKNGNLMICITKLFEKSDIGYAIEGNVVTFSKMYDEIKVNFDSKTALVNGKEVNMSETAELKDGEIYLPFEFVAEAFGYNVKWQNNKKIVEFTTN